MLLEDPIRQVWAQRMQVNTELLLSQTFNQPKESVTYKHASSPQCLHTNRESDLETGN